jgi:DNA mismatch endonuclease (patch repair protein)
MSAIRATENATEKALRSALHRAGLRFRKYVKGLPGKPDIVFPSAKVAVFVDGDYWHARVLREAGPDALELTLRTENRDYWREKFHKRVLRDDQVTSELAAAGWKVIRFWESEVKVDLRRIALTIQRQVDARLARTSDRTEAPPVGQRGAKR